jgi:oligosaccharyltransferase complex subunit alpha (ribophorin I)
MKHIPSLLFLITLCCLVFISATKISTDQTITTVRYDIYIQTNHEVQFATVTIKNIGTEPTNSFIHVISSSIADKLAYVKANEIDEDKEGLKATIRAIKFIPDQITNPTLPLEHTYFRIDYPTPLLPDQSIELVLRTGFHKTLQPFPASIPQNGKQRMLYNGYTNFFSIYPIQKYSTQAHTQSASIESFSPRRGVEKNGKLIKFGTVEANSPRPFDIGDDLTVHAENHAPFYSFREAKRSFDLAIDGTVLATENYFVEHIGAKLAGPFHRGVHDRQQYEEKRGQSPKGSEIDGLSAFLPSNAQNIEFRDFNGNISTSKIIRDNDAIILDFQLRYPLYGGWRSDFEIVYDYIESLITKQFQDPGNDNKVTFSIPFGYPFNDATGDELILEVLLPEGSTEIQWETPFELDSVETKIVVTYKDTIGRTQVIFRTKNVVPNMWESIVITYKLPQANVLLRGPPRLAYFIILALAAILAGVVFRDCGFGEYRVEKKSEQVGGKVQDKVQDKVEEKKEDKVQDKVEEKKKEQKKEQKEQKEQEDIVKETKAVAQETSNKTTKRAAKSSTKK